MLRKLAGQTAIYGISSIVARLLNYLLTPYLTRIMSPGEYGVITDVYALIPFALIILTLGLETGYFRFAGQAADEAGRNRVFASTWGAVTLVSLVFLGAVFLFLRPLSEVMNYADHPYYVWTMALIIALDAISAVPFARLRQQNRAMKFVVLRVISVVINVVLCVALISGLPHLAKGGGALWNSIYNPGFTVGYVLVANLVASAIVLLMLLATTGRILPRIDRKVLRPVLIYSMPLLLSGIAGTANGYIDRQMIKYLSPADTAMASLGIYGAVTKIAVVMVLFTQMYRFAAEPFFLSGMKESDFREANSRAMTFYIIVSLAIFLGITLFAPLFALIVGADFREGMFILPVILLTNIFIGTTFNLSFWYKQSGQTRYAIWVTGTGLAVIIVMSLILVPLMGYAGAALASMICALVTTVQSYHLCQKHAPISYDLRSIGFYFALGGAIYGAGFATALLPGAMVYAANILLLLLFCMIVVRREKIDVRGLAGAIFRRMKRS